MFTKGKFVIFCLLALMLSGCAPIANDPAFQPKVEESGGPKILYSLQKEQVSGLFPPNATLQDISARYGKPMGSGSGTDKSGTPTSWASYTYGRTYTHVNTDFNVLAVNRFTTVTLVFDDEGKLRETSFTRFQKYSTEAGSRDASDAEVTRFLGAPEILDIKPVAVAAPAALADKAVQADKGQGAGWKLGAEISELRSELIKQTGFTGRGVFVVSVDPQGLAFRSGIKPGDVICKINGMESPTRQDLIDLLKTASPASSLTLDVFSKGKARTVTIPAIRPSGDTSTI